MDRARKSGYVLADILVERVQGHRPTTLIGYSTGAVVIWECLLELAKRKEHGLINSGMPSMLTFQCHVFCFIILVWTRQKIALLIMSCPPFLSPSVTQILRKISGAAGRSYQD